MKQSHIKAGIQNSYSSIFWR